jgi:cytochrome bd-type quinol oxidase subunit 2
MRVLKTILLEIAFSFSGFVIVFVISVMRGPVETSHAVGLGAVVGGILEALLNPVTLLLFVVAFVAAAWVTRKTSERTST